MYKDLAAGNYDIDPMKAYKHNKIIKSYFNDAKKKAWASIKDDPEVVELLKEALELEATQNIRLRQTQRQLLLPTR